MPGPTHTHKSLVTQEIRQRAHNPAQTEKRNRSTGDISVLGSRLINSYDAMFRMVKGKMKNENLKKAK